MNSNNKSRFSYKSSGVDIDVADATKRDMAKSLETKDARVLNRIGAFASLFDGRFAGYQHPVLVLKMEEPGSKQKLAFEHGRVRSLCYDLVNHLINDIAVMGAVPVAVQDCVVCGKLEKAVVNELVDGLAEACRAQDCSLVGGETSEQPGVIPPGCYVLSASVVGVVEKEKIIDGSAVREGDQVLAVASSGLHTNGYSFVRRLIADDPGLLDVQVAGERFLDAIMTPHRCYFKALKGPLQDGGISGLAHITGGGIPGNLNRVIPSGLCAEIDLGLLHVLPIFSLLKETSGVDDEEMIRAFNLGVGLVIVCRQSNSASIEHQLRSSGLDAYRIGVIKPGSEPIKLIGSLGW